MITLKVTQDMIDRWQTDHIHSINSTDPNLIPRLRSNIYCRCPLYQAAEVAGLEPTCQPDAFEALITTYDHDLVPVDKEQVVNFIRQVDKAAKLTIGAPLFFDFNQFFALNQQAAQ